MLEMLILSIFDYDKNNKSFCMYTETNETYMYCTFLSFVIDVNTFL